MRSGGEKGQPLPFQLPLLLHLAAQCIVGLLELCERAGELLRHVVEAAAQNADLVAPLLLALPAKVQLGHILCNPTQADNRPGKIAGIEKCTGGGEQEHGQQQPGRHLL